MGVVEGAFLGIAGAYILVVLLVIGLVVALLWPVKD